MSPKSLVFLLVASFLAPCWVEAVEAAAKPKPESVRKIMALVADWQMAHPSLHPATDWTQAAYYAGMMALAGCSADPRYFDAMVKMGAANDWRLGARPYDADDHCVGQTYAEIFLRLRDPRMIASMRARFDWILAHPKDDNLDLNLKVNPDARDRWSWCDSLFMGPPTWVRLYAATDDRAYLDFVTKNWWVTSDYLFDQREQLFFRDSTYFDKREANGKKIFWSRGNGWVMAGLVRVLQYLPAAEPSRERFVRQFLQMADKIVACQQPDGLWRSSLLGPAEYPLKETSGSGFFCYALAWGINHRLLDRGRFEPAVLRAWQGLTSCVAPDGRLTHVQPIGADPKRFDGDATEVYGVGAFLLAGSEVYNLLGRVAAE